MQSSNPIRTKQEHGKTYVFDIIRKKYVLLTPEEKVRQSFIHFLIDSCKVPRSRMRSEIQLKWNGLIRRCDIVVYSEQVKPILIVECKKESIDISDKTLSQLARYNLKLNVQFLVATNLRKTYVFKLNEDNTQFFPIAKLPNYSEMCYSTE